MGALERFLLLQIIDERWREHLFDMDYLREGIHLRGFAQIDPLVAYKNEAFTLFGDLMNSVWADYARMIFNVQVNVEGQNGGTGGGRRARRSRPRATPRAPAASPTRAGTAPRAPARSPRPPRPPGSPWAPRRRPSAKSGQELEALPVVEQRVLDDEHQVGRNDPCWCGAARSSRSATGRRTLAVDERRALRPPRSCAHGDGRRARLR